MITMQIRSGSWDEGELVLSGMPEDFILSNRKLVILEEDEYANLIKHNKETENASTEGISEHFCIDCKYAKRISSSQILCTKDGLCCDVGTGCNLCHFFEPKRS